MAVKLKTSVKLNPAYYNSTICCFHSLFNMIPLSVGRVQCTFFLFCFCFFLSLFYKCALAYNKLQGFDQLLYRLPHTSTLSVEFVYESILYYFFCKCYIKPNSPLENKEATTQDSVTCLHLGWLESLCVCLNDAVYSGMCVSILKSYVIFSTLILWGCIFNNIVTYFLRRKVNSYTITAIRLPWQRMSSSFPNVSDMSAILIIHGESVCPIYLHTI